MPALIEIEEGASISSILRADLYWIYIINLFRPSFTQIRLWKS
jgi:hypothetical protein